MLIPLMQVSAEPTETVKWFNATYSPLTLMNEGDFNEIGSYVKTTENQAMMRKSLNEWWGVSDRKSADSTLQWLLKEGHRADFVKEMAQFKKDGRINLTATEWLNYTKHDQAYSTCLARMCKIYKERGSHAIDAWDYCRAMSLLGMYYVAGYYSKEETLDKSLVIANMLRQNYHSWDDLMQGYNDGYQYWCGDDITNPKSKSYARNQIFLQLKNNPDSLINTVAWNTPFQKTW